MTKQDLERELDIAQGQIAGITAAVGLLKEEIADLKRERDQLQTTVAYLEAINARLKDGREISDLRAVLHGAEHDRDSWKASWLAAQEKREKAEAERDSWRDSYVELERENAGLSAQIADEKGRCARLEAVAEAARLAKRDEGYLWGLWRALEALDEKGGGTMASDRQWAEEQAAKAVDGGYLVSQVREKVAEALLAAMERGRQAERERCLAIIADESVMLSGHLRRGHIKKSLDAVAEGIENSRCYANRVRKDAKEGGDGQ